MHVASVSKHPRDGVAGVPSALLHIGAVSPTKLAAARESGIPVPAPHSPEWAPDLEVTLKAAIRAEVTEALELLRSLDDRRIWRVTDTQGPPIVASIVNGVVFATHLPRA